MFNFFLHLRSSNWDQRIVLKNQYVHKFKKNNFKSPYSLPDNIYSSYELKWMYLLTSTAFTYVNYGKKEKSFAYIFEWSRVSQSTSFAMVTNFSVQACEFHFVHVQLWFQFHPFFILFFSIFKQREIWNSLLSSRR